MMTDIGDNVGASQIKAIVERLEAVQTEIDDLNDDKKDIYAEAKGNGFDPKVLKKVLAIRREDPAKRAEQEALIELYLGALGG
jgi:uncharacterized protein (UPF0335 family)